MTISSWDVDGWAHDRPELTRSERRSWQLHRRLSSRLTPAVLDIWRPTILLNLDRLSDQVTGQPHERNLARWHDLLASDDVRTLHRVLTGVDRDAVEMREVSAMSGLLSEDERLDALSQAG